MKKIITFILFVSLTVIACKEQQPDRNILDKNTFKSVLKEIILVNTLAEQLEKKDSLAGKKLLGLVYKKYDIDSLKLKRTTDFYSKNPEILAEIYQEIKDEFSQKKDSLEKLISPKKLKTDSVKIPKDIFNRKHLTGKP